MRPANTTFATLQDFANAKVIVTTEECLRGEPTIPLAHALHIADNQADYETNTETFQ